MKYQPFTSRRITTGVLILALAFATWSISLIVSANKLETEIRHNLEASLEMDRLDRAVRTFGGISEAPGAFHEATSTLREAIDDVRAVAALDLPASQDLRLSTYAVDSLARAMAVHQAAMLAAGADSPARHQQQEQFYLDLKQAVNEVKTGQQSLRRCQSLAVNHLDQLWWQLNIIALLACVIAVLSVILLRAQQRAAASRRRAEQSLKRQLHFLQSLIDALPSPLFYKDCAGVYRLCNTAFEGYLGLTKEEIVGKTVYDVAPRDLADVYKAADDALFEHPDEVQVYEASVRYADGTRHDVMFTKAVLTDVDDTTVGMVGIMLDITERKEFERQLVEATQQAEEMSRLKSAFLANMSHEIRTPLTSILGFAEILQEEVADAHRELTQLIFRGGRRLMSTLNSVLDLAQLESDTLALAPSLLDVADEVRDTLPLFRAQAEEKGLRLHLKVDHDKGDHDKGDHAAALRVYADRSALERVLYNLLSNALKFTREGEITVHVGRRGDDVRIRVADTGIGIDEAFLPHLFDEFRQESSGLRRGYEGSGLGLAITKRLVDLMDGTIEVYSEKGAGTTVVVSLPCAPVAEAPEVLVDA